MQEPSGGAVGVVSVFAAEPLLEVIDPWRRAVTGYVERSIAGFGHSPPVRLVASGRAGE